MTISRFLRPIIMVTAAIGLFVCSDTYLSAHAQARRGAQGDPVAAKVERATLAMQRFSWEQGVVAQCGFELNADFNAAINIGARADSSDGLLCRSKGSPNDQAQAPCL